MSKRRGSFYTGTDLGKQHDHSATAVVKRENDLIKLVFIKQFKLDTPFASVIGHLKAVNDRLESVYANYVDCTGLGQYIVEDMKNSGIPNVTGINFTMESKEKLATALKETMLEGRFKFPYNRDVIAELNVERYELTKTGHIQFNHPSGTHDDRFWAIALAVNAAVEQPTRVPYKSRVF